MSGVGLSPFARRWRAFSRCWSGRIGMLLVGCVSLIAIFSPLIAGDPYAMKSGAKLLAPGVELDGQVAWLGTDDLGRDMLARLLHGARYSLLVAITAVGLALLIGVPIGVASGAIGGRFDFMVMRATEMALSLPAILLAIVIVTIAGTGKMSSVIIAVALVSVPPYVRQVRATALATRQTDYVIAAIALGASPMRVLSRAILPSCTGVIVVLATLGTGTAILDAAGLNFLGLGPEPATPEWGLMLSAARGHVILGSEAWWTTVLPGLAILATVLGFNLIGDALRDAVSSGKGSNL